MSTIEQQILTVADIESRLTLAKSTLADLESSVSDLEKSIASALVAGQDVFALEQQLTAKITEQQRMNMLIPTLTAMIPDAKGYELMALYRKQQAKVLTLTGQISELEAVVIPLREQLKPLETELKNTKNEHLRIRSWLSETMQTLHRKYGYSEAALIPVESEPS